MSSLKGGFALGGSSHRLSRQRGLKRTGKIGSKFGNGKDGFCAIVANCLRINPPAKGIKPRKRDSKCTICDKCSKSGKCDTDFCAYCAELMVVKVRGI